MQRQAGRLAVCFLGIAYVRPMMSMVPLYLMEVTTDAGILKYFDPGSINPCRSVCATPRLGLEAWSTTSSVIGVAVRHYFIEAKEMIYYERSIMIHQCTQHCPRTSKPLAPTKQIFTIETPIKFIQNHFVL